MASNYTLKWSIPAFTEIRNSEEVQSFCLEQANAIKTRAESMGSGEYSATVQAGKNRAHASVITTDAKSIRSNSKHNSLLKAMRG